MENKKSPTKNSFNVNKNQNSNTDNNMKNKRLTFPVLKKIKTINKDVINDHSYIPRANVLKILVKHENQVMTDEAYKKILGIGFALQGLVSEDGTSVIYGEILKCTGLKVDVFTRWLDYPCKFVHEPDGAAVSELWVSPELDSGVYLSMSEHLGGALISQRKVINGMHRHSATFEHITACKDGDLCYCGKRGCYETICSKVALLKGDDPDEFFRRVRRGEAGASERWGVFLRHLGRLIAHLHLVIDSKFILGGHLAPYFTDDDIKVLYEYSRERTPFTENDDYILLSKMPSHNITIGAALPYIMRFLENVPDVKP